MLMTDGNGSESDGLPMYCSAALGFGLYLLEVEDVIAKNLLRVIASPSIKDLRT